MVTEYTVRMWFALHLLWSVWIGNTYSDVIYYKYWYIYTDHYGNIF